VSHLWFGDLVTMRWFDDVWLKEVFASLMADKIVAPLFPAAGHELRFVLAHYPAAYSVDRTAGAHPIRQVLDNLADAGSLYGPIIYHKAPIVMRDLEERMTPERFRHALRAYLHAAPFGNADWPDLVRVLGAETDVDVVAWSRQWIEGSGRPIVAGRVNPARLPYGDVVLDAADRRRLMASIERVEDPVARAGGWILLWEEMLEGRVAPEDLLATIVRALPHEEMESIVQLVAVSLRELFWRHIPLAVRQREGAVLEDLLRQGLERSLASTLKATYLNALRSIFTTPAATAFLERLWRRVETIDGLPLSEADEAALALEVALRSAAGDALLDEQRDRLRGDERRARFRFVMPAASADGARRDEFFARLTLVQHRRREPWVVEGLSFLNHPLCAASAARYIRPSLDLLEEIQRTGDIFFPRNWTAAVLDGHRSPDAAAIVRDFLAARPDLPPRLRNIVLQAADGLFRAAARGPD
jgi:aminopeptidase N